MFQNSALPSVSVDITQTIAGSLPRLRAWQGLARLDQLLPLPRTFGEYLIWLLLMAAVCALALLQISVSLQISQTQAEAAQLRRQYVLAEQQNAQLLWEISHFTTLERVQSEAVAAGFVPALNRRYVSVAPSSSSSAPTVGPAVGAASSRPEAVALPLTDESGTDTLDAATLSSLWDDWAVIWAENSEALRSKTEQLRDSLNQQLLKIDLSRYLWIGSPQR